MLLTSLPIYKTLDNDIVEYEEKMKEFVAMESMALNVYRLSDSTPKVKLPSELKNRGLYYWKENLKLIQDLEGMDLPRPIRIRNGKLKEYCELKLKSYRLIYKAIEEDTDKYENEINSYNQKIETIIKDLTVQ